MSGIALRGRAQRMAVRQEVRDRHPGLFPKPVDHDALVLGRDQRGLPLGVPLRARLEHAHVIGTTGGGKTKALEHSFRQDVIAGRGVCVVDPHGNHPDSFYRSALSWLDDRGFTRTRTIHLIDPNASSHITGFNPLALPDASYEPAVVAEAMLEAIERIWGEEDSNTKPTMQRVLTSAVTALCELGLTLAEARFLFDPHDRHGIRAWAIGALKDEEARDELDWLHAIAAEPRGQQDFRVEVTGPRNRLTRLTRLSALRAMVGERDRIIDFRTVLDEGHILLVNLSGGPRVSDKASQMLGRMLTRMLFFHATRRRYPERPFFFYLDECQLYLSGDVARLLAEARKYGVGCVLSHQYLAQFELAGMDILEAVKNTTNVKIVLRIKDSTEAADLADLVIRHDLETPVAALVKPTVIGNRVRTLRGVTASQQRSASHTHTASDGHSVSSGRSRSESIGITEAANESATATESTGVSVGWGMSEAQTTTRGSARSRGRTSGTTWSRSTALGTSEGTSEAVGRTRGSGRSQGDGSSRAAHGTATSDPMRLDWTQTWQIPTLVGITKTTSEQSDRSESEGDSVSRGRTAGRSSTASTGVGGSEATSESASESVAYGAASTQSRSGQRTQSRGTAHTVGASWGVSASSGWSDSVGVARSWSVASAKGESVGSGRGESVQEALEPIYRTLPTAVHSLENVRYVAAQALRSLTTGHAIVNYVGAGGMTMASVRVANVDNRARPPMAFEALRERVFDASPSASRREDAQARLAEHERQLLARAAASASPEPATAAGFRQRKSRSAAQQEAEAAVAGAVEGQGTTPKRRRAAR